MTRISLSSMFLLKLPVCLYIHWCSCIPSFHSVGYHIDRSLARLMYKSADHICIHIFRLSAIHIAKNKIPCFQLLVSNYNCDRKLNTLRLMTHIMFGNFISVFVLFYIIHHLYTLLNIFATIFESTFSIPHRLKALLTYLSL